MALTLTVAPAGYMTLDTELGLSEPLPLHLRVAMTVESPHRYGEDHGRWCMKKSLEWCPHTQ